MPTLLCIDDYTYGSALLQAGLDAQGYQVIVAPDAGTALEMLRHTTVDAILLDCHMAGLNCTAFVSTARSIKPATPVVMLAAFCSGSCRLFKIADGCVQKGENLSKFLQMLDGVIRSSKYGPARSLPRQDVAA